MLEQEVQSEWLLIAFFGRHHCPQERKYNTFDRELLAVYLAIHHFRYVLETHHFVVRTNYKPLTFVFTKDANPRWCTGMSELPSMSMRP